MPHAETAAIDVTSLDLIGAPDGRPVTLGGIGGVHILVLLRHRH
jgi:hypothetical protein